VHDARDGVEFSVADPDLDLRSRLDVAHLVGAFALGNKVEVPVSAADASSGLKSPRAGCADADAGLEECACWVGALVDSASASKPELRSLSACSRHSSTNTAARHCSDLPASAHRLIAQNP
jgi:hypothetical protein